MGSDSTCEQGPGTTSPGGAEGCCPFSFCAAGSIAGAAGAAVGRARRSLPVLCPVPRRDRQARGHRAPFHAISQTPEAAALYKAPEPLGIASAILSWGGGGAGGLFCRGAPAAGSPGRAVSHKAPVVGAAYAPHHQCRESFCEITYWHPLTGFFQGHCHQWGILFPFLSLSLLPPTFSHTSL